jgi:hypothetical protein
MSSNQPCSGFYSVEERSHGGTVWVAIRARGSDYSWLTPEEAAFIGRQWVVQYGVVHSDRQFGVASDQRKLA